MEDDHLRRLLAELDDRSNAEIEQVRSEGRAAVDTIRRDAAQRTAERERAAIASCVEECARQRAESLAAARRQARADLLVAQHALVDRVIARVRSEMDERFSARCALPALFRRVDDLRSYAPDDVTVTCRAKLAGPLRAARPSLHVAVDEDVSWGVLLTTADGHMSIADTVDAWLDEQHRILAMKICLDLETAS